MPDLETWLVCPHCNREWHPHLTIPPGPEQCPTCGYKRFRCPEKQWPTKIFTISLKEVTE